VAKQEVKNYFRFLQFRVIFVYITHELRSLLLTKAVDSLQVCILEFACRYKKCRRIYSIGGYGQRVWGAYLVWVQCGVSC